MEVNYEAFKKDNKHSPLCVYAVIIHIYGFVSI